MTLDDKLEFLKKKFLETAYVADAEKGYIVVESFNLAIDPDVLEMASRCWAQHYHDFKEIDGVVGLPDAGARLVSILAEMLRVKRILPSKRAEEVPGAWRKVVSYSNKSFTMGLEDVRSHIGFVEKGAKVLLVDDVVARGNTAVAAIQALQAYGVEVLGLAVMFDKAWQGGVERIKQDTGVDVYSLVSIQAIESDGTIQL